MYCSQNVLNDISCVYFLSFCFEGCLFAVCDSSTTQAPTVNVPLWATAACGDYKANEQIYLPTIDDFFPHTFLNDISCAKDAVTLF